MGKEVKTKRGAVTAKVARETLIAQAYEAWQPIRCCHCRDFMIPDQLLRLCHIKPLELGGDDFWPNRAYGHETCELEATKEDRKRIDKAKGQAGETGQQKRRAAGKTRKIQGAGFQKPTADQKAQRRERQRAQRAEIKLRRSKQ